MYPLQKCVCCHKYTFDRLAPKFQPVSVCVQLDSCDHNKKNCYQLTLAYKKKNNEKWLWDLTDNTPDLDQPGRIWGLRQ